MASRKTPPLQSHHHIRMVERQLNEAMKVRNILIVAGKITLEEFEAAESLVRSLAPDSAGAPTDGK